MLSLHGRDFQWTFLLAAVAFPILGIDFLRHYRLMVDPVAGQLVDIATATPLSAEGPVPVPPHRGLVAAVSHTPLEMRDLLVEFQDVFNEAARLPPPIHGVEHHLVTSGHPVSSRFRRLDGPKLAAAKAEFAKMEADGIVRRSSSCWSSPLHMVQKSDDGWRPCGDYRRFNLITSTDCYPLPNMNDLSTRLDGCTVFSKLDLRKGYYQIPVHPADIPKTAVITPFGLFEFTRMPFGLKNAGMSFQRLMDRVLAGLPFIFVYLDDILIASQSIADHRRHLQEVLSRLRQFGLVLNLDKCVLGRSCLDFLGHKISASGARPLESQVAAVQDFPQPGTIKEMQAFLGLVNFYRRFIPGAAGILLPLTSSLRGGVGGHTPVPWTTDMLLAFANIKQSLASAVSLAHPAADAVLVLVVDASATHVGAALQQQRPGDSGWEPLGFFSKKLESPQLVHSAFDRELLQECGIFASCWRAANSRSGLTTSR